MDFRPSPAQQLLASTAREFLRRHARPSACRNGCSTHAASTRRCGVAWPSSAGRGCWWRRSSAAAAARCSTWCLLVEEMGYACLPGPFVTSAVVATSLLAEAGSAGPAEARAARARHRRAHRHAGADGGERLERSRRRRAGVRRARTTERPQALRQGRPRRRSSDRRRPRGRGPEPAACCRSDRRGISRLPLEAISGEKLFEVVFDGVEITAADRLGARGTWRRGAGARPRRRHAGADGGDGGRRPAHSRSGRRARQDARAGRAADRRLPGHPARVRRSRARRGHRARAPLSRGVEDGRGTAAPRATSPSPRRTPGRRAWRLPVGAIRSSARSATARSTRSTCSTSGSRPPRSTSATRSTIWRPSRSPSASCSPRPAPSALRPGPSASGWSARADARPRR